MAEISESTRLVSSGEISLSKLPTELFFHLFKFVPPKDMMRCRQVCVRWRDVIDSILRDGTLWECFCKREYRKVYKQAMWKSPNITNWFELYRSLSLWSQLEYADETIEEFCLSDTVDEIKSAVVQEKGVVLVHKRTRVVYHDLMSLHTVRHTGFIGQYIEMKELEDVVILRGINRQLRVVSKPHHDWHSDLTLKINEDDEIIFEDVNLFIVDKRNVFFSTLRHQLYTFNLDDDKSAYHIELPETLTVTTPHGLCALGSQDGCLYILTMSLNMYMYVNKKVVLKFSLANVTNLMDCLYQHNMLENIDFRHYYMIHNYLKHKKHPGLLHFIIKIKIYGDHLLYIGTQNGIVCIYYKPFIDGQLDLTKCKPVKLYNFTLRIDKPIMSLYPIISIEVTETKDGHKILVCMPRKILVITYKHDFEKAVSRAVVPYIEQQAFSV